MKGLLIKDLSIAKGYAKQYGIILILMLAWAYFMKSISIVAMYAIMIGGMQTLTTMTIDENSGFNRFAMTTPLSARKIILAKYIFLTLGILTGTVVALLLNLIPVFLPGLIPLDGGSFVILIVSPLFALAYAVSMPFIYKYGMEKTRYIYLAVLVVVALLIAGGSKLLQNLPMPAMLSENMLLVLLSVTAYLLGAVSLVISYHCTLNVFRKKEW